MANNCTKPANDVRCFELILNKLGHRSAAHLVNNLWKTSIVYTAANVDGRGCYPQMKAGHLVMGRTSTEISTTSVFVCTVAPTSSTDAGTFVFMHA